MPKRILIINTGGTLSSVKSSNGLVPGMSSGDMLEELRMVSQNLELETEDFCSFDSSNIGPGISPEILDMYYEKGYKAVYIEGFGLGGMPFLKNDFTGKVGEVIEKGMLVLAGEVCIG